MTDALFAIANRRELSKRYYDFVHAKSVPVDPRSGQEIADDVMQRLGLKRGEKQ